MVQVGGLERDLPLLAAGVAPVVVRDAEQPGGEGGVAAELPEPAPRLQEGVLGQVVGQRLVPAGQVAEETPDGGLVAEHQFAEGIPVALEGPGDQHGIGRRHDCGGREPAEGLLRKL
jgi:hypothetical protein